MGQDLRELLQNSLKDSQSNELSQDHELRFLDKLNASFEEKVTVVSEENKPQKALLNSDYKKWLSIAASLLVSISLGVYIVNQAKNLQHPETPIVHIKKQTRDTHALANVSPEFKQVEENYLSAINIGLAQLKVTDSNRGVVRSGMAELKELKEEYQAILADLKLGQIHPQILEALIYNLKMQLSVLERLQQKVKSINEYSPNNAYQNLQT